MSPPAGSDDYYKPRDALSEAAKSGAAFGLSGLFLAAIVNARRKVNVGAMGVFRHGGRQILSMSTCKFPGPSRYGRLRGLTRP